jgi:hypothetical protein
MPVSEICHHCQALAPAWSSTEYVEWHVVSTARGECLGVVCSACLADDELVLLELESSLQAA